MYNEDEDPRIIEEKEKKEALNKLKLSDKDNSSNNKPVIEEPVKIEPITTTISISN